MTSSALVPQPQRLNAAFRNLGSPRPRAGWKRLVHRSDPDSAAAALETLLATTPPAELTAPHISVAIRDYGLSSQQVRSLLTSLWRRAVERAVDDDVLTDDELADLTALRFALQVSEDEAAAVEQAVVHPRYKQSVMQALSDGRLTVEEKASLERLAKALRIEPVDVEQIYAPLTTEALQKKLDAIIEDHRVSPDELVTLGQVATEMGRTMQLEPDAEGAVRRYAEFWKIENQGPVPISVPTRLLRGEECYLAIPATWHELRRVTTQRQLGTIGYSVPIARGVYYRSPRLRLPSVKEDVLTALDAGTLYVTNQRLLFDGQRGNKAVGFRSILGFTAYSDGVKIEKSSGKSPVLVFQGDAERACVILGVALARAEAK